MNGLAVSNTRAHTPDRALPPRFGSTTVSFQDVLASIHVPSLGTASTPPVGAQPPGALPLSHPTVVRQGDCLSRMCAARLKEQGGPVSRRDIYGAVQAVAKANHLANPDRIYTGQKLDLSMLHGVEAGPEAPEVSATGVDSKPWQSLVDGAVALSSPFGLRKDPFTGAMKQHAGIDVAAPSGAPISAFEAGSVTFSGWLPGYGNTVIIRHEDGLESLYGHLSRSLVQVGESVGSHTPIACVGSSGHATGAHLHFEVRRHGEALNPIALLEGDLPKTSQSDLALLSAQMGSLGVAPPLPSTASTSFRVMAELAPRD